MTAIDSQERFAFGKNWANFLKHLDESRIQEAIKSLQEKLECEELRGKTFLDVGAGSGLFSLAAHRLGAKVYSFDYDRDSVACTQYLKDKFSNAQEEWWVGQGSVLNADFLKQFGQVDILYSWGVLHHTGSLSQAFENVAGLVKPGGRLFISIYNNQGDASKWWLRVKRRYNKGGAFIRYLLILYTILRQWTLTFAKDLLKSGNPFKSWFSYAKNNRGMSAWHDVIDWVGGYPFEVAKPEEVFEFFKNQGFSLKKLKTCAGGVGCNEFVFIKL